MGVVMGSQFGRGARVGWLDGWWYLAHDFGSKSTSIEIRSGRGAADLGRRLGGRQHGRAAVQRQASSHREETSCGLTAGGLARAWQDSRSRWCSIAARHRSVHGGGRAASNARPGPSRALARSALLALASHSLVWRPCSQKRAQRWRRAKPAPNVITPPPPMNPPNDPPWPAMLQHHQSRPDLLSVDHLHPLRWGLP